MRCENHARLSFSAGDGGCLARHDHRGCDCGCLCGCQSSFRRHFMTRAERIEQLGEYREALEAELEGVKEHLAEMSRAPRARR